MMLMTGVANGLEITIYSFCLFISYNLLKARLLKDSKQDYFPNEKLEGKTESPPKILLLGKEVEPESHQNEKDERYFRITERKNIYLLTIFLYLISVAILIYFLSTVKVQENILASISLAPIIFIGYTLGTKNSGELMVLPLSLFFFIFVKLDWYEFEISLRFITSFTLIFLTLLCFKHIHSMRESLPENKSFYSLSPLPYAIISSLLFTTLLTLFPNSISENEPTKKNIAQKLNRSLGRISSNSTDEKYLEQLKVFEKNIQKMKMDPKAMNKYFDQAENQLDQLGSLLENLPDFNIELPTEEVNALRSERNQLKKELSDIKFDFNQAGSMDPEMLNRALGLMKKIDDNAKRFNGNLSSSQSQSLSENFEDSFKSGLNEKFLESFDEERGLIGDEKFLEKTKDLFNRDNQISKRGSNPLETINNQKETILSSIQEEKVKEEKKKFAIDPKLLDKILNFIQIAILISIGAITLAWIKKFFFEEDEIDGDDSLTKEEKKKLLLKRKYATSEEEVRALYLQFNEAVKKVHYGESEPPPPRVLYSDLREVLPRRQKALKYFTENFSFSEYGAKEIQKDALNKYRKAYRLLIKSL